MAIRGENGRRETERKCVVCGWKGEIEVDRGETERRGEGRGEGKRGREEGTGKVEGRERGGGKRGRGR